METKEEKKDTKEEKKEKEGVNEVYRQQKHAGFKNFEALLEDENSHDFEARGDKII